MSLIIVDCETDGALIGTNSMVCFGAVVLEKELNKTFYGQTSPVSEEYDPEALAISSFSREEHDLFPDPKDTMIKFGEWLRENSKGKPTLISDNNGYDASWINWYFLKFTGSNPFGWSSRRIGDMFCGFYKDAYYRWKKYRITKHTHNPLDDCMGNAEALLYLKEQGFKIKI